LASAGLIVGSVISSGGFAALFVKIQAKQAAHKIPTQSKSKEKNR